MEGTITFSAKRSNTTQWVSSTQWVQYAVCSRYAVCTFSAKRSNPHSGVCSRYAVGMQYAVGVSAKRSTHTEDLANVGGGDCYL